MSFSQKGPHVAIAGGGIIGLACAFRLASEGARVSLFEKGEIGSGASCAAAGMLAPNAEAVQDGAEAAVSALGRYSLGLWRGFAKELKAAGGPALKLNWSGSLLISDSAEDAARMKTEVKEAGGKAQTLDRAALEKRLPALAAGADHGVWLSEEGHVNPREAVEALLAASQAAGVEIFENASVRGIETRKGALSALRVEQNGATQSVACDAAVIAGGVEAALSASCPALGLLYPVKGQMVVLDGTGVDLGCVLRGGAYLIPRNPEEIWVGATAEHGVDDLTVKDAAIQRLRRAAAAMIPALAEAKELRRWAGLRPGTRDSLPLIGPNGPQGVYLAAGHYRNGILSAPATAEIIATMILKGETPDWAETFLPERASALTRV